MMSLNWLCHSLLIIFFVATQAEVDINTTLCVESQMGNIQVVENALRQGADPAHLCDTHFADRTPLIRASMEGHDDVVKVLLEAGATTEKFDRSGRNALLHAANTGSELTVRVLLEGGANPEAKDPDGKTALLQACKNGRRGTVKALVEGGADLSAADKHGGTALMWCSEGGSANAVGSLIEAKKASLPETEEGTAQLKAWLDARDSQGRSAVLLAATTTSTVHYMRRTSFADHYLEILQKLLLAGADVNLAGNDGMSPLMAACRWSNSSEIVAELIDPKWGAKLNQRDTTGRTAIMFAAFANFRRAAELLVEAGASFEMMNDDGWSAETIAIKLEHHDVRRVFSNMRMRAVAPELFQNKGKATDGPKDDIPQLVIEEVFDERDVPPEVRELYEDHEEL